MQFTAKLTYLEWNYLTVRIEFQLFLHISLKLIFAKFNLREKLRKISQKIKTGRQKVDNGDICDFCLFVSL